MKLLLGQDAGSYAFSAAAKTITVTGLGLLSLENFLLATNVTQNVKVYQFNLPALGGVLTGVAGNQVLTLTFDTTTMADTDDLQIFVIDPSINETVTANAGTNLNTSALALEATQINGDQIVGSQTLTKKTVTASASGPNTIHTPAAGKKVRLYYLGYSAGATVSGVLVGMRFTAGGADFDNQYLISPGQPFGRNIQAGKRYIDGGTDELLVVNLSAAQTVYCNVELEEVN